jgi:hypothetical protein
VEWHCAEFLIEFFFFFFFFTSFELIKELKFHRRTLLFNAKLEIPDADLAEFDGTCAFADWRASENKIRNCRNRSKKEFIIN